jgi:O-methyltransferase involved in polyketide biosynthesis
MALTRSEETADKRIEPALGGVPETMLWTLYSRAREARRADGILKDDMAIRIFDALGYDFERNFGVPDRLFSIRAALLDGLLRAWLERHPQGTVVSLGEGLETQAYRVDNGRMTWLSVDLPEAIELRERFLQPTGRFRHLAMSALDPRWMDGLDDSHGIFVVAQGLLMYLEPEMAEQLVRSIAARFPGGEIAFDIVPRSLSAATLRGHNQTSDYALPMMPFGLNRNEVAPTLRRLCPRIRRIRFLPYRTWHRRPDFIENFLDAILPWRQNAPSLVHVRF